MTWVIWRQHRRQAIVAAAALGVLTVFFGISGPAMSHTYHSSGLATCMKSRFDCGDLLNAFDSKYNSFQFLVPLFLVLPALIGVFWGAPLIAREFEQGTYRFAWTQSVSRRHWVVAKIAGIGGATIALGAVFAGLVTWWSVTLITTHTDRFVPGIFDLRGIVPIGYTLFAIALGIVLGEIIGKVLPAMGATLLGFAVVRIVLDVFVRKHYMTAKTTVVPMITPKLDHGPFRARGLGEWILGENTLDKTGHIVARGGGFDFGFLSRHCPNIPAPGKGIVNVVGGKDPILSCVGRLGLQAQTIFQPGNRYWTFQWIEFGIYAVLAAGLLAFAVWRIKSSSR